MTNNVAGPGEMIRALGKQRVLMGFAFASGKGDGDIIRAIGPIRLPLLPHPLANWKGTVTPRLKRSVRVFNRRGSRDSFVEGLSPCHTTTGAVLLAIYIHTVLIDRHRCRSRLNISLESDCR
jgi:hypothetical protein